VASHEIEGSILVGARHVLNGSNISTQDINFEKTEEYR
jgi:hypothetical protein